MVMMTMMYDEFEVLLNLAFVVKLLQEEVEENEDEVEDEAEAEAEDGDEQEEEEDVYIGFEIMKEVNLLKDL